MDPKFDFDVSMTMEDVELETGISTILTCSKLEDIVLVGDTWDRVPTRWSDGQLKMIAAWLLEQYTLRHKGCPQINIV